MIAGFVCTHTAASLECDPTGDERRSCGPDGPLSAQGEEHGLKGWKVGNPAYCLANSVAFHQWVGRISNILKITLLNLLVKLQFKMFTQFSKYFILRNA